MQTASQGNLSLLASNGHAGMPRGHIVCYKSDHRMHLRFLHELQGRLKLVEGKLEEVADKQ